MALNTGFSEITDERAKYQGSGFWYSEIALTGKCNFKCNYCNRFKAEVDVEEIKAFITDNWASLRHVQFTGGEPTLSPYLYGLCQCIKQTHSKNYDRPDGIKIGLSTNGSEEIDLYRSLGVDMFSISLDDYDIPTLMRRGYKDPKHVIEVIKALARNHYVNVGLVIDHLNITRLKEIIKFITDDLGARDIKLSMSTKNEVEVQFTDPSNSGVIRIIQGILS